MKTQIRNANYKGLFLLVLVLIVCSSCEDTYPEYTFIDTSTAISVFSIKSSNGREISFENTSAHATKYLWDFGDGQWSEEKAPSHLYESKGIYTVTLVAADNNDVSNTLSLDVPVGFPIADFTYEAQLSTGTFTNNSSNASSYLWDFGDGETSIEENPVHEFPVGGKYQVQLTAFDAPDEDAIVLEVIIPGKLLPEILNFSFEDGKDGWIFNDNAGTTSGPTPPDGEKGGKVKLPDGAISQTLEVSSLASYRINFWFTSKKPTGVNDPIHGGRVLITDSTDPNIILADFYTGEAADTGAYEPTSVSFSTLNSTSITVNIIADDSEVRVDLFTIK